MEVGRAIRQIESGKGSGPTQLMGENVHQAGMKRMTTI